MIIRGNPDDRSSNANPRLTSRLVIFNLSLSFHLKALGEIIKWSVALALAVKSGRKLISRRFRYSRSVGRIEIPSLRVEKYNSTARNNYSVCISFFLSNSLTEDISRE